MAYVIQGPVLTDGARAVVGTAAGGVIVGCERNSKRGKNEELCATILHT